MLEFLQNYYPFISLAAALIALFYVILTARRVLKFDEGTDLMKKDFKKRSVTERPRSLKRQYAVVTVFFLVVFAILETLTLFNVLKNPYIPFAFLTGGIYSGLSGFIGMKITTASNARTAKACTEGLNKGLRVAFSAGSVMGFTVVGLGLLDLSVWLILLKYAFGVEAKRYCRDRCHFRHGSFFHGAVCKSRRRYIYQSG